MANPKSIKVFGKFFDTISAVANHYEISESALAANTALTSSRPKTRSRELSFAGFGMFTAGLFSIKPSPTHHFRNFEMY
jgi:hypothetical protein